MLVFVLFDLLIVRVMLFLCLGLMGFLHCVLLCLFCLLASWV